MHLVAVVCANGLGHYRRTIGILSRIREKFPDMHIDLVCESWQVEAMRGWHRADDFWLANSKIVTGVTEPGVRWHPIPSAYEDGRLLNWENRLSLIQNLDRAQLVLSDNLSGVLSRRPDTILLGSFLWSDVLSSAYSSSPNVMAFVEHERSLLVSSCPPMVCVTDAVMSSVVALANTIHVGWMCETSVNRTDDVPSGIVGVVGSGSGIDNSILVKAVYILLECGWQVAISERLRQSGFFGHIPQLTSFGFSDEDFRSCDFIVCRPGMGIITDCIAHGVPIIALCDSGNIEMVHIGQRVAELGLGRQLVVNAVDDMLISLPGCIPTFVEVVEMRKRMLTLDRNGLQQAADWIIGQLPQNE